MKKKKKLVSRNPRKRKRRVTTNANLLPAPRKLKLSMWKKRRPFQKNTRNINTDTLNLGPRVVGQRMKMPPAMKNKVDKVADVRFIQDLSKSCVYLCLISYSVICV